MKREGLENAAHQMSANEQEADAMRISIVPTIIKYKHFLFALKKDPHALTSILFSLDSLDILRHFDRINKNHTFALLVIRTPAQLMLLAV
jgi:hypothetical protein